MEEKVEKDVSICWEREKKEQENGEVEQEKREKREERSRKEPRDDLFSVLFPFFFLFPKKIRKVLLDFFKKVIRILESGKLPRNQ